MKPVVNKELCIGCGTCASICAEVFKMGADNKSEVIEVADLMKNKDCIDQAVQSCPAQAISLVD